MIIFGAIPIIVLGQVAELSFLWLLEPGHFFLNKMFIKILSPKCNNHSNFDTINKSLLLCDTYDSKLRLGFRHGILPDTVVGRQRNRAMHLSPNYLYLLSM